MTGTPVQEAARRRTFAIISHPDAGKTTLTEKFLLYAGAVVEAAAVLHPQELLVALVELMVPDRRDVEAERVHRLDGRLVVEGRGQ